MKKHLFISFLLLGFFILSVSFSENQVTLALQKTEQFFHQGLEEMGASLDDLQVAAQELTNEAESQEYLQETFMETRRLYKQIEFLVAYLDKDAVKKHINGAPLPTVEPNVPEVIEISPSGLQILNELIFAEENYKEKELIIDRIQKLKETFPNTIRHLKNVKLTHRLLFEGMREELVRVFTLGVTGFDTPGSTHGIIEARIALESVYKALREYLPLVEEKDPGVAIVLDARMDYTLKYLADHPDFETFDRLTFLKEHIEPQYEMIYELHKSLQIEFNDEDSSMPISAVNYHAPKIFSPDFLDAGYFSNLNLEDTLATERTELGKTLFFDPILSKDIKSACSSCHQPDLAFTDGRPTSLSSNGTDYLKRNAPSLINSVYADHYFWDLREPRLDRQMLHVIKSDKEFDTNYVEIIKKLKQSEEYKALFASAYPAYPEYQISTYSISNALSHYVSSLTDFDSDFDKYLDGRSGVIEEEVKRGFNLFMGKAACGTCHFAPVFNGTVPPHYTESESEVLGVPMTADSTDVKLHDDMGRYANGKPREEAEFYKASFKTVTVRNVEYTAPYMHNGVYETLEEVMDFYNKGGGKGMGMDLPHQTLPFDNLNLNDQEINDIIAFMKALSGDMSKFTAPDKLPTFENQPEWNQRSIPVLE